MVERFRAEGIAIAGLHHRAIVGVYDTIAEPELDAIVMELVKGPTLRRILDKRGPLAPRRALEIGIHIAEGLQAAHDGGVIHRDVKPANILVPAGDSARITDFGIAKSRAALDLTEAGTYFGTARYLAPEQVTGRPADARSDVYALATVIFEMIAGSTPFNGESETAIAVARLQRPAPLLRELFPTSAAELDTVVNRALLFDPLQRYATAGEFAVALERVRAAIAPTTRGPATEATTRRTTSVDATQVHAVPSPTPPPAAAPTAPKSPRNSGATSRHGAPATTEPRAKPAAERPAAHVRRGHWIGKVCLAVVVAAVLLLSIALVADTETLRQLIDRLSS